MFQLKSMQKQSFSIFMKSVRFNAFLQANIGIIIPVILTALVIILGGIAVYLAEHKQPGANITNLGDALWWSVITITTVGYGDYTPVSMLGRIIGTIVMFSGIGIAVTLVTVIEQGRVQRMQERLKSKTEGKAKVLANETKVTIKDMFDFLTLNFECETDLVIFYSWVTSQISIRHISKGCHKSNRSSHVKGLRLDFVDPFFADCLGS